MHTQSNQSGRATQYPTFQTGPQMPFSPQNTDPGFFKQNRTQMEPPAPPGPIGRPPAQYGDITHATQPGANLTSKPHSRNTSTSSNVPPPQTQPIGRPAPIQRPPSASGNHRSGDQVKRSEDVDDLVNHLGSKALLDDEDDVPLTSPVGAGSIRRQPFAGPPGLQDPIGTFRTVSAAQPSNWSSQSQTSPFGNTSMPWPPSAGFARPNAPAAIGTVNNSQEFGNARAKRIWTFAVSACQILTGRSPVPSAVPLWHRVEDVQREVSRQVQMLGFQQNATIAIAELMEVCGHPLPPQSSNGTFELAYNAGVAHIRYHPAPGGTFNAGRGDIGSPIGGNGGGGGGGSVFGASARPFYPHPQGGFSSPPF